MKSKILIALLFAWFSSLAQSVPNTNTFRLTDVTAITGGTSLSAAFANSNDAYFDPTYKGSKDRLSNFRNYTISACPNVGDSYEGGAVAYLFISGDPGYISGECHGIIVSTVDLVSTNLWGCDGTDLSGASGTALGTGLQNTIDIITGCTTSGIPAKLCYDYSSSGYSDWSLPSKNELAKIQDSKAILGIANNSYWSSSEVNAGSVWAENFSGAGVQNTVNKTAAVPLYVRAIRYF